MRKYATPIVGVLAMGAICVAPSVAQSPSQTVLTVDAKVSSSKAGTKKKPKGVNLTVKTTWTTPPQFEPPITQKATAFFPKGSLYNGKKYPSCSLSKLNRKGPKGCPKGSIMGSGTGSAFADTVITRPKITVVNGGAKNVWLYTVLNNPARVQTGVPGKITKLSGNPKYGYRLDLTVPQVLQVVAGVPIQLRDLTIKAGKKDWLATTSCPKDKKWRAAVETSFDNGGTSGLVETTVPCR